MLLAVAVEPVKATLSTRGCWTNAVPVSVPRPLRTFTTPGGKPAWVIRRARMRALRGVCSAGLRTMVLPQASAGPSLRL